MSVVKALLLVLVPSLAVAGDPCASSATLNQASQAQGLVRQKKFADGETSARAVLKTCKTQSVALAALGGALVGQEKYDDAITQMTAAINAQPTQPYPYLWRGKAYYSKQQPDRMVTDFQTFLKLAPNAPEAPTVQQLLASLQH